MNRPLSGRPRPAAGAMRHLASILALPFMNTVVIPAALLAFGGSTAGAVVGSANTAGLAAGTALLAAGGILVVVSIAFFAARGEGTLAPWDPPRRLVVVGPYRFVRHPMKTGLIIVLLAEAVLFRSPSLAAWCAVFAAVNVVYIRISEEPGLERRFGAVYARYRDAVPAWLPRLTPWSPPQGPASEAFRAGGTPADDVSGARP